MPLPPRMTLGERIAAASESGTQLNPLWLPFLTGTRVGPADSRRGYFGGRHGADEAAQHCDFGLEWRYVATAVREYQPPYRPFLSACGTVCVAVPWVSSARHLVLDVPRGRLLNAVTSLSVRTPSVASMVHCLGVDGRTLFGETAENPEIGDPGGAPTAWHDIDIPSAASDPSSAILAYGRGDCVDTRTADIRKGLFIAPTNHADRLVVYEGHRWGGRAWLAHPDAPREALLELPRLPLEGDANSRVQRQRYRICGSADRRYWVDSQLRLIDGRTGEVLSEPTTDRWPRDWHCVADGIADEHAAEFPMPDDDDGDAADDPWLPATDEDVGRDGWLAHRSASGRYRRATHVASGVRHLFRSEPGA